MTKKKNLPQNVFEKDDSWIVRRSFTLNGKRKQIWRNCDIKTTRNAAKLLREIDFEISNLLLNPPELSEQSQNPTCFKEISLRFETAELIKPIYIGKKKVAGKSSVARNKHQLKVLIDHFGKKKISEITFGDVQTFKFSRIQTPVKTKYKTRPRSIRTVHYELSTLRQVFNYAIRERLLNRSPLQDGKGLITPTDNTKRFVTLTESEQIQLIENIDLEKTPYLKVVVVACLDAGFRFGEIAALEWKQINFEDNTIKLFNYQTKTAKERTLPMSQRLRSLLIDWKSVSQTGKVIDVKRVIRSWKTLRNSINRPDLHIHDLRHCFATRLHAKGVGIATISRLLGHASIKTTQIYINPSDDELKNAVSVLD